MKLWQLVSVMKQDVKSIQTIATTQAQWQFLDACLAQYSNLVDTQDRAKLDYELPDDFVRLVLAKSDLHYYLSTDGWLRSWQMSPDNQTLTTLEAFNKYGGAVIEEAWEKGCVEV